MSQAGRLVDIETSLELLEGNVGGPVGPNSSGIINVVGTGAVNTSGNPGTNTLTIGITPGTYTESFDVDATSGSGVDPVVPNSLGVVTVTGNQVASGTTSNVIQTNSPSANTYAIEIQRSTTNATPSVGLNGVSHFNSSMFSVDSDGFVSLLGGEQAIDSVNVDATVAPGTNPVLAAVDGSITITGNQVASGTTSNVIRSNSDAANSLTIEIQRSTTSAIPNADVNGVCHFDSSMFSVDSDGFVTLSGGSQAIDSIGVDASTAPGTDPVVPDTNGLVSVTGSQVAAATTTNVIRTNSVAANAYSIEIQRSKTESSSTVGSNGVSHFDSSTFSVDSNGFVTLSGPIPSFVWSVETTGPVTLDNYHGYFANGSGVTFNLPATAAIGDTYQVVAMDANGFTIAMNTGQTIQLGANQTTTTTGTILSTGIGDWIEIVCNQTDVGFFANVKQGNLTVT